MNKTIKLIILLSVFESIVGCGMIIKPIPPGLVFYPTPYDYFIRMDTDVRDVNFHYRKYPGTGENIILIHGFASSTFTWEDMVLELRALYFTKNEQPPTIWSIDLKGFGWSDKPENSRYDPFTLTDEVNQWMDKMGINNATIVGNSLGGAIAWILALDHKDKVHQLVLVDAGGYPVEKQATGNLVRFANVPFKQIGLETRFARAFVQKKLKTAFYKPVKLTDNRVDAYYNRLRTKGGLDSLIACAKSIDLNKFSTYIKRICDVQQKTLIIWGHDDTWIPLKNGCRFKDEIDNSTIIVIPQCGHMPQEEQPEKTAEVLHQFLTGTLPSSYICNCVD